MKRAAELFTLEGRSSRSPFIEETWHTRSEPTKATIVPIPEDASDLLYRPGTTATFDLVESRVLSNGIILATYVP